ALAIASGMGAGLIESSRSGGSVKKFQGGWSAHCGVVAAQMAADGLTGAMTAIEGKYGFFTALVGSDWRQEDVEEDWESAGSLPPSPSSPTRAPISRTRLSTRRSPSDVAGSHPRMSNR